MKSTRYYIIFYVYLSFVIILCFMMYTGQRDCIDAAAVCVSARGSVAAESFGRPTRCCWETAVKRLAKPTRGSRYLKGITPSMLPINKFLDIFNILLHTNPAMIDYAKYALEYIIIYIIYNITSTINYKKKFK